MPNKPREDNPSRTIRVEDDLWAEIRATTADRGDTASEVARRAFKRYVGRANPPSADELEALLEQAEVREGSGSDKFVTGVAQTLRWVLGETPEPEL